jgi:hypothetical protein
MEVSRWNASALGGAASKNIVPVRASDKASLRLAVAKARHEITT